MQPIDKDDLNIEDDPEYEDHLKKENTNLKNKDNAKKGRTQKWRQHQASAFFCDPALFEVIPASFSSLEIIIIFFQCNLQNGCNASKATKVILDIFDIYSSI